MRANPLKLLSVDRPLRQITSFLTGTVILLLLLLGLISIQARRAFDGAADTQNGAVLVAHYVTIYHILSAAKTAGEEASSQTRREDWQDLLADIEAIRASLRPRYPEAVAATDRAFDNFSVHVKEHGTVDWMTTEACRKAASHLVLVIQEATHRQFVLTGALFVSSLLCFFLTLLLGVALLTRFEISQRRLQQENLDQAAIADRMAALFSSVPVACYSFDRLGNIQLWNRTAEVTFGRTTASVQGKPIWAILARPENYQAEKAIVDRVGRGEEMPSREWSYRVPDGTIHALLTTTFPLRDLHDAVIGGISATVDITARKEAEARLQRMVEGARCIMWDAEVIETNDEREFAWESHIWNEEAAQRVLPLDTTGKGYINAWVESRTEEQPWLHAVQSEALRQRKTEYFHEYSCHDRDGKIRWLSEYARIYALGNGRWRVTGLSTDITERKRIEERLVDVLAAARCILWEASVERRDGTHYWDMRILNESTAQHICPLDTSSDKYEWAWDKSRFAEDRVRIDRNADEAFLLGSSGYQQEFRCRDRNGEIHWFHEDVLIKPQGERVWQVVGVCREITLRKRAEEQLENVLNTARCILWDATVTENGDELVWNLEICNKAAAMEVIPLDTSELAYEWAWTMSRLPEDRQVTERTGRDAILCGSASYSQEFRCRDRHGVVHWLHEEARIQPLEPGHWRVIGVCTDITELKSAETQLQMMAAELSRSNAALQDFASIASHDLKEPVRKIQTFGNLLARKLHSLPPDAAGYLERMLAAAAWMQSLIDGLLSYSRVTTKGITFAPTDLNRVVRDVLTDLEVPISELQATVHVAPLPTIPADALQMRQLFQNLIGNALKFHRDNGPTIVCIHYDYVGGKHIVAVEDNGIGFSNQNAERIFDVFERLHGGEREGTGIGLAICRKIVERHGGSITAIGNPGIGATFTITLDGSLLSS